MTKDELLCRAHGGIVGISEGLRVSSGYDETHIEADPGADRPGWIDAEDYNAMPKAEKLALADLMLDRWSRYRQVVATEPDAA